MNKIIDIQGFNVFDEEVDYESMWVGKFILNSNGSLEGISNDGVTDKLHLIKGQMKKDYINIYCFSDKDNEVCKQFTCVKKDNVFDGIYLATDSFTSVPIGECTLKIKPAEKTREVTQEEINSLKERIEVLKSNLGKEGEKIYSNIENNKEKTYQKIK